MTFDLRPLTPQDSELTYAPQKSCICSGQALLPPQAWVRVRVSTWLMSMSSECKTPSRLAAAEWGMFGWCKGWRLRLGHMTWSSRVVMKRRPRSRYKHLGPSPRSRRSQASPIFTLAHRLRRRPIWRAFLQVPTPANVRNNESRPRHDWWLGSSIKPSVDQRCLSEGLLVNNPTLRLAAAAASLKLPVRPVNNDRNQCPVREAH